MSIESVLLHLEKFFSNPILWGVMAVLAIALALSGRVSMTAAVWLVWVAWALAAFGAYRATVYFGLDATLRILTLCAASSVLAVGAVLLNRWFVAPKANSALQIESSPISSENPKSTEKPRGETEHGNRLSDPIDALSRLGWSVKRDGALLQFEVSNRSLPKMTESERYLREIREPFRLRFQTVPNIDGLEHLSGIEECKEVDLSASDLSSVSQLAGFVSLQKLEIVQIPLNTHENINSAPLANLVNITSLVLGSSRFSDLTPVARMPRLERLIIGNTLIRDLSPVRSLSNLKVLDVRDSQVTDISPVSANTKLEELVIDMKQVSGLTDLSDLSHLHKLTVIGQIPVDLSPIGSLSQLQSLFIWGSPFMNLKFLNKLPNLTDLQLSGFGAPIGPRSQVTDSESICAGGKLNTLTLGALEAHSLNFTAQCKSVTELNLRDIPLASLDDLAAMQSLKKISLVDIPVVEISPLLALPNLENLSLIRVPARADIVAVLARKGVKVENP